MLVLLDMVQTLVDHARDQLKFCGESLSAVFSVWESVNVCCLHLRTLRAILHGSCGDILEKCHKIMNELCQAADK